MSPHEMELLRRIIEALETIASGFKQRVPPVLNPPPKTENGIDNALEKAETWRPYPKQTRPARKAKTGGIPLP